MTGSISVHLSLLLHTYLMCAGNEGPSTPPTAVATGTRACTDTGETTCLQRGSVCAGCSSLAAGRRCGSVARAVPAMAAGRAFACALVTARWDHSPVLLVEH